MRLATLIASVLLTLTGASKNSGRMLISGCLAYVLSLLAVAGDIMIRLNKGDSAGVMDIYPTMLVVYLVVAILIGLLCYARKRRNS